MVYSMSECFPKFHRCKSSKLTVSYDQNLSLILSVEVSTHDEHDVKLVKKFRQDLARRMGLTPA